MAHVRRRLKNGEEVLIRPIRPEDGQGLREGFERLSPESRYRRFFTLSPTLSNAQLRYLTEVDHRSHEALLAIDPETRHGLGVARFVRFCDEPSVAEVAVAVADDWQQRGLGTALLHELTARAREEGITRFRASVLAENQAMMGFVKSLGEAHVMGHAQGLIELLMDLPDEGLPESLRHAVRAAARGDIELERPDRA
jgi:RimJ/RimL family protein N-acetyltransferase